jgi:hypothetical protein
MADETVKLACPGCGAIFQIPIALSGELGECTECDTVFEIPNIAGNKHEEDVQPIIPKMSAEDIEATGTVKLSRASIGMIPDLKDAFNFGVAEDSSATHSSMAEVFATPAATPAPKKMVATPAPTATPEPAPATPVPTPASADKPRHGGLHIAKPKAAPLNSHNPVPDAPVPKKSKSKQKAKKSAPAQTPAKQPSNKSQGLANVESIVITEDGLSEKDKIVTLILCVCLGLFGAHRFYVGKLVTGFIMMITFGGLGIWWWIDLIMIVTDNFKDVDGLPMK